MATITLPHTFVDGSRASADDVMDNFYDPASPSQSFESLNGYLDNSNRAAGWGDLDFRHIRQGAFTSGQMVGKTEPLDFMSGSSVEMGIFNPNDDDLPGAYTPISGSAIEFYLPDAPTAVLFTWQIFIGTDVSVAGTSDTPQRQTNLHFFIDGTAQSEAKRELPFMFVDRTTATPTSYNEDRQRVYSGHLLKTGLAAGWHSASLRMWSSANIARVRVRNMKYIRFK